MKKLLALILSILLSLAGCEKYTIDVAQYGQVANYITFPDYFPEAVDTYQVNGYSYRLYSYMDICYEIYLDISVEIEEMERLIATAKEKRPVYSEGEADYARGYREIVFRNAFTPYGPEAKTVSEADIEKIVYDPDRGDMVFVRIYSVDAGVYPVAELAYFNRFDISAETYTENIG